MQSKKEIHLSDSNRCTDDQCAE